MCVSIYVFLFDGVFNMTWKAFSHKQARTSACIYISYSQYSCLFSVCVFLIFILFSVSVIRFWCATALTNHQKLSSSILTFFTIHTHKYFVLSIVLCVSLWFANHSQCQFYSHAREQHTAFHPLSLWRNIYLISGKIKGKKIHSSAHRIRGMSTVPQRV